MKNLSLLVVIALVTNAFAHAQSSLVNVFEKDNREYVYSYNKVLRHIIYFTNGCTGSFVGDRLIITAAHCVTEEDDDGQIVYDYPKIHYKRIGSLKKKVYTIEKIWAPDYMTNDITRNDWALVLIKEKRNSHYFGFSRNIYEGMELNLAGFHGDLKRKEPGETYVYMGQVKDDCEVDEISGGIIRHTCDSTRGASGSPLFKCKSELEDCYIYAIHVASYRNGGKKSLKGIKFSRKYANKAVPVSKFRDFLVEKRKLYNVD